MFSFVYLPNVHLGVLHHIQYPAERFLIYNGDIFLYQSAEVYKL